MLQIFKDESVVVYSNNVWVREDLVIVASLEKAGLKLPALVSCD
jgi:hypothetical protein